MDKKTRAPERKRCRGFLLDGWGWGVTRHRGPAPPWRAWYNTARWRALRLEVFERDLFTCQRVECGALIGDPSRLVCDHRKAHRGDERLFWDQGNLQTLCKHCHDGAKQREEQASLQHRGVWH